MQAGMIDSVSLRSRTIPGAIGIITQYSVKIAGLMVFKFNAANKKNKLPI